MLRREILTNISHMLETARLEYFKVGDRDKVVSCEHAMQEIDHHLDWQSRLATNNADFLERHVKLAYENYGKIDAIKLHKRLTGLTLIDSKRYVEDMAKHNNWMAEDVLKRLSSNNNNVRR